MRISDWSSDVCSSDLAVRDFAADWREALRALPPEAFLTDPDTALAAAILFDQVPRNIYRGSAEAFATDSLARAIARAIVEKGWDREWRSEEHTSELQSLMRSSYAVFCLNKKITRTTIR